MLLTFCCQSVHFAHISAIHSSKFTIEHILSMHNYCVPFFIPHGRYHNNKVSKDYGYASDLATNMVVHGTNSWETETVL